MNKTIIVENIDVELLNKQLQYLYDVQSSDESPEIAGLINMIEEMILKSEELEDDNN